MNCYYSKILSPNFNAMTHTYRDTMSIYSISTIPYLSLMACVENRTEYYKVVKKNNFVNNVSISRFLTHVRQIRYGITSNAIGQSIVVFGICLPLPVFVINRITSNKLFLKTPKRQKLSFMSIQKLTKYIFCPFHETRFSWSFILGNMQKQAFLGSKIRWSYV